MSARDRRLKLIAAAVSRVAPGAIKVAVTLDSWSTVIDNCRTTMAFSDMSEPAFLTFN